ncbi:MAG: hypothetical protein ACPHN2_04700 [Sinimarinibacterium flocculans]|uniref:hypothetical protein n=1 Tax=Sinimarinibacterium flocculans TaxID=985250 RepID=UPI003C65C885
MPNTAANLTPNQLAATVGRAIQCEGALRSAGIEDPAELQPMHRFAIAAEARESALRNYRRLSAAHKRFAQTHDHDDPAHEDHQRAVACAQAALTSAEQVMAVALTDWQKARGL